jgi:hypothetical protein
MVCCVFQVVNLVNTKPTRKSARFFVSRLALAINFILCWAMFFTILFDRGDVRKENHFH